MGLFGLSKNVKLQIENELKFVVCSGFFSELTILVNAQETMEEICECNGVRMPSERYCLSFLEKMKKKYIAPGANNENFNKLNKVFEQLNEENIIAVHYADYNNGSEISRVYELLQEIKEEGKQSEGYCVYHEYDVERAMETGVLYLMYGCHNADDTQTITKMGERIVALLCEQGFDAAINKEVAEEIIINNFVWDKVYDGKYYAGNRSGE